MEQDKLASFYKQCSVTDDPYLAGTDWFKTQKRKATLTQWFTYLALQ